MDKTSQIFRDAAKVVADSKGLLPVDKERAAGLALQLAQLRDKIDAALKPLKEALRNEVVLDRELAGVDTLPHVETIEGCSVSGAPLGTVTVTMPTKLLQLSKNADYRRLRRTLGPAFEDYFDTHTTFAPVRNFQEVVNVKLTQSPQLAAEARIAMAATHLTEQTTRVGFKPKIT